MIHIILRKKLGYCVLAFFLFAIICVWKEKKKGGYYDSLKEETEATSLEKLVTGYGPQSSVGTQVLHKGDQAQGSPKSSFKGDQGHGNPKSSVKTKPSFQVWDKDSSSKNLPARLQSIRRNYLNMNKYKVSYNGPGPGVKLSPEALRCHLRDHVNVSMVEPTDFPFNTSEWEGYLPKENFRTKAGPWGRCAVVSSAGSLKSSQLGREIDDHDAVLRFNAAPTANFQQDVGTKTTLRLVNSQVKFRLCGTGVREGPKQAFKWNMSAQMRPQPSVLKGVWLETPTTQPGSVFMINLWDTSAHWGKYLEGGREPPGRVRSVVKTV